jgi:hypothetical protein
LQRLNVFDAITLKCALDFNIESMFVLQRNNYIG